MPIFEITQDRLVPLQTTAFSSHGLHERADLQRLLRDQVEIIDPDVLVISEEFGGWEDSKRRIDLLGIDRDANLVVIELKRTEDGGHMELQALRYAAMVSKMTFDKVSDVFATHLAAHDRHEDSRQMLLAFSVGRRPMKSDSRRTYELCWPQRSSRAN
jgi:RecB family endonuclease NucS